MVRFQATGVGDLGDESGASSLPTGPEFSALPPDGVVPCIRARSLFLRLVCPCVMSVMRDAELVSWSTDLVPGALLRLESLLGWGTKLVGLEHRAG